jgi:hypothetical protein
MPLPLEGALAIRSWGLTVYLGQNKLLALGVHHLPVAGSLHYQEVRLVKQETVAGG